MVGQAGISDMAGDSLETPRHRQGRWHAWAPDKSDCGLLERRGMVGQED